MKPEVVRDDEQSSTVRAGASALDATRTASPSAASDPAASKPSLAPPNDERSSTQVRDPERYRVIGEHGRGGLGRVSRAHDRELGRDVAIKELISRGAVSELRFAREALITARLEHPGIVPVHEAGRWPDGTPFYAMKLVSGRPLRDLIAERTTVEERIGLLHHVIAVADAIAYAHGRNVIHRDLKPANVIVGDFGETIVIDWGLAKDISTADELEPGSSAVDRHRGDELTSTGSVLGTPAYMAPEQARGEPVDQRADVFAIGAMLWELCASQKVPPTDLALRRRILRRSNIDPDLIAIVDKALEPSPHRRYHDAGALAADLKAFKAGARIAARSYSMFAVLAHWARRRRAVAVSIALATVLATLGTALYVHDVAAQRDRADQSQRVATNSLNERTLQHAETLLLTDPTAALEAISTYRGADRTRARQIQAEALGRGVATLQLAPQSSAILWIQGLGDGAVAALHNDGTITRTTASAQTEILARNVKAGTLFTYAANRHLLAYICEPDDLCILDVVTGQSVRALPRSQPNAMAFSPDESELAIASKDGSLRVFEIRPPSQPVLRFEVHTEIGGAVLFVDRDTLAVGGGDGFKVVHRDGSVKRFVQADDDGSAWDVGPEDHQLILESGHNDVYLLDTNDYQSSRHKQLCHDSISRVRTIREKKVIVFACHEGTIGLWDPRGGTTEIKAHMEGPANSLEVSRKGDYVAAAGTKGTLTVIDLSSDMTTTFAGHGLRISSVMPPTETYPLFLSGDVQGRVRAWRPPSRVVRTLADLHSRIWAVTYNKGTESLIATTRSVALLSFSKSQGLTEITPHEFNTPYLTTSPDGATLVAYGNGKQVELWSTSPISRKGLWDTRQDTVTHAEIVDDAGAIMTSGSDGSLVRWTTGGDRSLIRQFDQPIETFSVASGSRVVVIATRDGALWSLDVNGRMMSLRSSGSRVTKMLALPDRVSVAVGYADGMALIVNTQRQQLVPVMRAAAAIRDIASNGKSLTLTTTDGVMHTGAQTISAWSTPHWTSLSARVRKASLTHDGLAIAICTDGAIWIYSTSLDSWMFLSAGQTELGQLAISDDDTTAFAIDIDGHVISVDLKTARDQIEHNSTSPTRK